MADKTKNELIAMTDTQHKALMLEDYKAKKIAEATLKEQKLLEKTFYDARTIAFDELSALWQSKEDNGWDINFVPK